MLQGYVFNAHSCKTNYVRNVFLHNFCNNLYCDNIDIFNGNIFKKELRLLPDAYCTYYRMSFVEIPCSLRSL